ncbi:MAG: universal stress protein [Desulfobacterales bacterium]|nr:universal stress protein [Desulfobacterales bacterium]
MKLPKVEIKKILYATDLSESARHAFAYAVSLANAYGASITILHVLFKVPNVDSIASFYIGQEEWKKIKQRTVDDARQALIGKKRENVAIQEILTRISETASAAAQSPASITDEIIIKKGNPEDHILQQAEERNCDIIVMGSHGHSAIAEAVIGNTARKVLRRSKIPVLAVRLPQDF